MMEHSEVYLAHLYAGKGNSRARYPCIDSIVLLRRSMLPHSEGGVFTS